MKKTVKGKTEKQFLENKLVQLLYLFGTSGNEERVQKYLIREINEVTNLSLDFGMMDNYGNIHARFISGTGNGATLHLNSHMDTVKGVREDKKIINDNGVFKAVLPEGTAGILGADDRAGIATILTLLNFLDGFNGIIKVSFYREEEIGCVGSTNSDKTFLDDVALAITFDRRGSSDIVVGCMGQPFASNEVGYWLEGLAKTNNHSYVPVEGGISDALTVSEYGVNAVNLSVGYYNEHTIQEYLVFSELFTTYEFSKLIVSDINKNYGSFGNVPKDNDWVKSWGGYGDSTYDGDSYSYGSFDYGTVTKRGSLFAPIAYVEDGKYAVVTDGSYEMDLNLEEVDDLIYHLEKVRSEIEANMVFTEMDISNQDLPF